MHVFVVCMYVCVYVCVYVCTCVYVCAHAHSVGHTLGLRHNFKASHAIPFDKLTDIAYTSVNGIAASVMDYLPVVSVCVYV